MNTEFPLATQDEHIERLHEAVRVMEGLSDQQRANFDIRVYAVKRNSGIASCIAGYCGFDPWFQVRGFVTRVGVMIGDVSMTPAEFFGTAKPFYPCHYVTQSGAVKDVVRVDDAIAALRRAIQIKAGDTYVPAQ